MFRVQFLATLCATFLAFSSSYAQEVFDLEKGTLSCVNLNDNQWLTLENFATQPQIVLSRSVWAGVMNPQKVLLSKNEAQAKAFFGTSKEDFVFSKPVQRFIGFQQIVGFTGELVATDVKFDFVWGAQSKKTGLLEARLFVSRKLNSTQTMPESTITFNDCVILPNL